MSCHSYHQYCGYKLSSVVNEDGTVNIDPEGIAVSTTTGTGGFWIVSEGKGTVGDEDR